MELEMKNKGFTLVELLVALAVFSLVVVAMSATAVSVIKSQRKGFALQEGQETARYLLESVSKEIRMSTIDSSSGENESSLSITNAKGENVDYRFNSQKLQRQVNGGVWQDLNPFDLKVTGSFYIRRSFSQPVRGAVTLVMKVKANGGRAEGETEINLQSTLSSRSFE
ncbi:MAG: hypothetical protein COS49_01990 [Candidatus Portnoybacteria bacterium CG03_land_8_20_14_0_80_41_10]|uniref:Prepilin-type N-terminal cleavage/methylation domain-containing protein n=1 Tax=Candidatus Portnoybacteria bacterium CG03_land_8_20_14_0_80_41_10 TaxID=1974808 RepID=A0A2M7BUG2_9BACT|nr:MAG: hypothetical protein COS49_01990 [Candidatus Portnoybacteria bacterium CG03_land_8_20_14_0_80_41_10]